MMALRKMDAGDFSRQLTVENETELPDGLGGFVNQYQSDGTIWAHIRPVSARQTIRADNDVAEITHRIIFRFRAGIVSGSRLVTGARRFDVLTVRDVDETRRYLECECVERT